MANKICQKCGKMMDEDTQFYTYKNGNKTEMCKNALQCILTTSMSLHIYDY